MAQRKAPTGATGSSSHSSTTLAGMAMPDQGEGVLVAGIGGWLDTKNYPVETDQCLAPLPLRGVSLPFARGKHALHPTVAKWISNVRLGKLSARGSLVLPGGVIERVANPILRHFIQNKEIRARAGKKQKRPPYKLTASKGTKDIFHAVSVLSLSDSEGVRQFMRRLRRPHLLALVTSLCGGGDCESSLINRGYCLLSDPLYLAMSNISDDVRLAIVECAQEGHTGDFMKLLTLWRCARQLDRRAALEFSLNGMAQWSRSLNQLADEAQCALEKDPSTINDWRVNTDGKSHLFSTALLDVLGMLPQTRVIWTACRCAHVFGSDAVDEIASPADYIPSVSTRPLVVNDAGAMTAQQARLILATRKIVEFRGSLLTGVFESPVRTGLPALVVMAYCYNLAKLDPAQPVYRTTLGMLIHPPKTPRKFVGTVEKTLEVLIERPKPIKSGNHIDTRPLYSMLRALCDYSAASDPSSSISLSE